MRRLLITLLALLISGAVLITTTSALGHGKPRPLVGTVLAEVCVFPTTTANPDDDPNPLARAVFWQACTITQAGEGGVTVNLLVAG